MSNLNWFVDAARANGWTPPQGEPPYGPKPHDVVTVVRDGERIDIEVGSGGIPRTVRHIMPNGDTSLIAQNYISMSEVMGWLFADQAPNGLEVYINCDEPGCAAEHRVFTDELPPDWQRRVYCPEHAS